MLLLKLKCRVSSNRVEEVELIGAHRGQSGGTPPAGKGEGRMRKKTKDEHDHYLCLQLPPTQSSSSV